jgi:hypothetical protein
LPVSLASCIAFFAAGDAVGGFKGSSGMSGRERGQWMQWQGYRWGYGRFRGRDGRVHVGVEREDFIMRLNDKDISSTSSGMRGHGRREGRDVSRSRSCAV